jgi:hypothetical protein
MLAKDHAILEVEIANLEPSRLLIEIALRQPPVSVAPAYDEGEIQRAIRDGVRELLTQVELQRLVNEKNRPPRVRRWIGRIVAFIFCAAIGSAVTVILSTSHTPYSYALESLTPPGSGEPAPSREPPSPGSQSRGAPDALAVASSTDPAGPATFGLHER